VQERAEPAGLSAVDTRVAMSDEPPDEERPRLTLNPLLVEAQRMYEQMMASGVIEQVNEQIRTAIALGILVEQPAAPSDEAIYAGPLAERMAKQRPGDGGVLYSTDEDRPIDKSEESPIVRQRGARGQQRLSADEVIATYYRRHAHNRKISLKQVCEDLNVNYGSIRVAKVAYDKRRKRGRSD
jgi:hypothetical protein